MHHRFLAVFDRLEPFRGRRDSVKISSGQDVSSTRGGESRLKTVETAETADKPSRRRVSAVSASALPDGVVSSLPSVPRSGNRATTQQVMRLVPSQYPWP